MAVGKVEYSAEKKSGGRRWEAKKDVGGYRGSHGGSIPIPVGVWATTERDNQECNVPGSQSNKFPKKNEKIEDKGQEGRKLETGT